MTLNIRPAHQGKRLFMHLEPLVVENDVHILHTLESTLHLGHRLHRSKIEPTMRIPQNPRGWLLSCLLQCTFQARCRDMHRICLCRWEPVQSRIQSSFTILQRQTAAPASSPRRHWHTLTNSPNAVLPASIQESRTNTSTYNGDLGWSSYTTTEARFGGCLLQRWSKNGCSVEDTVHKLHIILFLSDFFLSHFSLPGQSLSWFERYLRKWDCFKGYRSFGYAKSSAPSVIHPTGPWSFVTSHLTSR